MNCKAAKSLLEVEKPKIEKLAQFAASEHSTILFTVADYIVGYTKEGRVAWITSENSHRGRTCPWPHPTLSHDGLHVAYITDAESPKHCSIVIFDLTTATQRELGETTGDPGEISWSWNDGEIVFFDSGISAISALDGTRRVLLPFPLNKDGRQYGFWVWYPMQWLHNGKDLIVELRDEISYLLLVGNSGVRPIDAGSEPSVSPISDHIAYYGGNGIVMIGADGTGRTVLTKAPTRMLFFAEEFFGNIVWSPNGTRLFFGTIVSDCRMDKVYLLDVNSRRCKSFLSRTSITVRGWTDDTASKNADRMKWCAGTHP